MSGAGLGYDSGTAGSRLRSRGKPAYYLGSAHMAGRPPGVGSTRRDALGNDGVNIVKHPAPYGSALVMARAQSTLNPISDAIATRAVQAVRA